MSCLSSTVVGPFHNLSAAVVVVVPFYACIYDVGLLPRDLDRLRPLIPAFAVVASYGVAIAYVSADAVAKGFTCAKESDSK